MSDHTWEGCRDVLASDRDSTVIVVDIPASIEAAQGVALGTQLLSCEPLQNPFATHGPQTKEAAKRLEDRSGLGDAHIRYCDTLARAERQIQDLIHKSQPLCLPRRVIKSNGPEPSAKRRKLQHDERDADSVEQDVADQLVRKGAQNRSKYSHILYTDDEARLVLCDGATEPESFTRPDLTQGWPGVISNRSLNFKVLRVEDHASDHKVESKFCLPANSCCLLGDCSWHREFVAAKASFLSDGQAGRFDLIVLDPPWPNSSVSRKKNYDTASDMDSLVEMLEDLDLDTQLNSKGFIAAWITNRPSCREAVLGSDGLFSRWKVSLVEEWIWLKVTSKGVPVTAIDGLWRKPYEILLIGQRPTLPQSLRVASTDIRQRVLVGVPDLHSRKPCIKNLAERLLLPLSTPYNAAEIFARYPVSGWVSWGNEVLKYSSTGCWSDCPT